MSTNRSGLTATSLPNGDVLVAGGGTASADLYDPTTRTFSPTGAMTSARTDATATLLPDGQVLVSGGRAGNHQLATAELYDPASGAWSPTGSMRVARSGMTATLLGNGTVLVAGGGCNPGHSCNAGAFLNSLRSAELYHPDTGVWTRTGAMSVGRQYHTATLLPDGRVFVTGGFTDCDDDFCEDTTTTELYDPSSGIWSNGPLLRVTREAQTATLLSDGTVLIAGGRSLNANSGAYRRLSEAELYDPSSGTIQATGSLAQPHAGQTATLLPNGWVLLAGGGVAGAEVYQTALGAWVPTGTPNVRRTDAAAATLPNGQVLVAGGGVSSAETYNTSKGPLISFQPAALRFPAQIVGSTSSPRTLKVTNEGDGPLKVAGVTVGGGAPGDFSIDNGCTSVVAPMTSCTISVQFAPSKPGLRSAAVKLVDNAPDTPQQAPVSGYGDGANVWFPTGRMSIQREWYAAAPLKNGNVLIAGGDNAAFEGTATAEIYDPETGSFTSTGSMSVGRSYINGAALPDGRVLVAGGLAANFQHLSSAEIFNPASGTWSMAAPMNAQGYALTETTLADGDVLVTGLGDGTQAEIYNPSKNTWTDTGPTVGVALFSTVTLLPSGLALAAGDGTTHAGLYDPSTNTWSATGSMRIARNDPSATLLADGEVLVSGGRVPGGGALASAELYNPSTATWALTSNAMSVGRDFFSLVSTPNGVALAIGGCSGGCTRQTVTNTVDEYNPNGGYWFPVAAMTQPRATMTAVALRDGDVLVAGGSNYCCTSYRSAEVYGSTLLTVSPKSGPVGTTIQVRGSGFYAFETVKLRFSYLALGRAHTGPKGGFSVTEVVPQSPTGEQAVSAFGLTSYAGAQCTFTVTASAPHPGGPGR